MNAHTTITADLPWSTLWEQARGTWSEKDTLALIAAEARDHDWDVWCASMDALMAKDPAERAGHIADLEALLDGIDAGFDEREIARDRLRTMPVAELARIEAQWAGDLNTIGE